MREFNTSGPCDPAQHYTVMREASEMRPMHFFLTAKSKIYFAVFRSKFILRLFVPNLFCVGVQNLFCFGVQNLFCVGVQNLFCFGVQNLFCFGVQNLFCGFGVQGFNG